MEFEKNFGNYVELHTGKEIFEGVLLPSPESGFVLLKLDNGYNIGFRKKDLFDLKVLKVNKKVEESVEIKKDSKKKNLPRVGVVILGGTIVSRLNPGRGGVDFVEGADDLFKFYPALFDLVDVSRIEVPFMKGSENMDFGDWQKVSRVVSELVNDKSLEGVLVLQGTDTLHYTSSALSFFLRGLGKPVVVTYSQRSIDRASSDANLNLICSGRLAISDVSGVFVVGHGNSSDDFCYAHFGTKVRKLHSSRRDAFRSVNKEPLAKIYEDRIEFISDYSPKSSKKKCFVDSKFEEKVGVIKFIPGQDPEILDYYISKGYKGLIIEFLGIGNIAVSGARNNWSRKLKDAMKAGLVICAVAQTINGRLNPLVYVTGRELSNSGIIYLEDMLSETAFVKLGWVLGHKDWVKENLVKEKMLENISGEFNERIVE